MSGTRHEFANPAEALEAGVETVYQDLALVESFDLAENLFLGRELVRPGWLGRLGVLRKREMEIGPRARPSRDCRRASPTSRHPSRRCRAASARRSPISKAAFWGRKLLLLDEPTAALGIAESAGVLDMIGHAAQRGDMGMIVIAHNLQHIFRVCSRILVLRQGRLVADLPCERARRRRTSSPTSRALGSVGDAGHGTRPGRPPIRVARVGPAPAR